MKALNVFGKQVKIKFCSELEDKGEFDSKKLLITLQKGMDAQETRETLLHEIVHAMCHIGGLRQAIPHELEEVFAEQFASVMTENFVLRRK